MPLLWYVSHGEELLLQVTMAKGFIEPDPPASAGRSAKPPARIPDPATRAVATMIGRKVGTRIDILLTYQLPRQPSADSDYCRSAWTVCEESTRRASL
jgi:hypothetical protein